VTRISSANHLALHCQPKVFLELDEAGKPTGINTSAFRVDENGISTNWIEWNSGDFAGACSLMSTVRTIRKSHMIGVMNVGDIEQLGASFDRSLQAHHDPITGPPPNPGHALVIGAAVADAELLQALTLIVELRSPP
jgi:hypothetical protein